MTIYSNKTTSVDNHIDIRELIRSIIISESSINTNSNIDSLDEDTLDEERIVNVNAYKFVKKRQNFIGSHIFGEDIGGKGEMYVAFSYGEQYPAYIYYGGKWYKNKDGYAMPDGTFNRHAKRHLQQMKPTEHIIELSAEKMKEMLDRFKRKYSISKLKHTSVNPGEKN